MVSIRLVDAMNLPMSIVALKQAVTFDGFELRLFHSSNFDFLAELSKGFNGFGFVVVGFEDGQKLRDLKEVLHSAREVHKF